MSVLNLVIAENFQIQRLFSQTADRIFDGRVRKISLKINEETVFKSSSFDRALFNLGHIQVFVNKMLKQVIQGSAFVRNFHADTDF